MTSHKNKCTVLKHTCLYVKKNHKMLQIEECTFPTSNASVTIEKTFSYQSVGEDDRAILKLPTKKLQKRLYCVEKTNVTVSEKTANFPISCLQSLQLSLVISWPIGRNGQFFMSARLKLVQLKLKAMCIEQFDLVLKKLSTEFWNRKILTHCEPSIGH